MKDIKLTVTIRERSGGLIPQTILVNGSVRLVDLGDYVARAVATQTVYSSAYIEKVTLDKNEVYERV